MIYGGVAAVDKIFASHPVGRRDSKEEIA